MKALQTPIRSPLQLDRYFLKGLHFELRSGYDQERSPVPLTELRPPELEIGVVSAEQNPDDPLRWRFEVSIELPDSLETEFPYKFVTSVVGYFTVSASYPAEHAERLARVNGPAVLYSSAREVVAAITGRSPYPKMLLPSMTFVRPGIDGTQIPADELPASNLKELGPGVAEPNGNNNQ